jgi:hypothetical protein
MVALWVGWQAWAVVVVVGCGVVMKVAWWWGCLFALVWVRVAVVVNLR